MATRKREANEPDAPVRVFISATSKDLGTVRELVKQALLTMGCMPVEQTNFAPDYRSVQGMIEDKIADCEAVIHIVGLRYGAEPDPSTLPKGAARRSYTQMEADIARQLGKKLYLFVCPEDFPYDDAPPESEDLQALQQAYRAEISKSTTVRTEVADREEVGRKVRELQFELEKLKSKIGQDRRRMVALLAALLVVLCGIGLGVWWFVPSVIKHEHEISFDLGKAREQFITEIKTQAQKNIDAAGDDWRKVDEIKKSRDQQLSDLDRVLERIGQTYQAGEASESYRKATDLLAAKGVDEALAYLEARKTERKSLIETQASRRDQEEAELRKLLQEELLAASLLNTKFQFDAAEAKYRQVVENSGSWAEPRNDLTWFLIQRGIVIDPALGNRKLREALEFCSGTLGLTSRDAAPQDWADTQTILGTVLTELGERSSGEQSAQYLTQSLAAFRSALEVRTREQLPHYWALTQNGLGNALQKLGIRSSGGQSVQYLDQSLDAYCSALEVYTREQLPQYWATTQNNLGLVLHQLWKRSSGEQSVQYLTQEVDAYCSALEVYTREQLPQYWAGTQNNLGTALAGLGTGSSRELSVQYLTQSVDAYRSALKVRTREELPHDWADTQNNLGTVLGELGIRSSGEESVQYLTQSVDAYRSALEVRTREQLPEDWAMTKQNLGKTLQELWKRSSGERSVQYLDQSLAAYCCALEVYTREQLPQEWAWTQTILGITLKELGRRSSAKERARYLKEAVAAYENALSIFTPEADPYNNEMVRRSLEETRRESEVASSKNRRGRADA